MKPLVITSKMIQSLKLPNQGRNTNNCDDCGQPIYNDLCDCTFQPQYTETHYFQDFQFKTPEEKRQEFLQTTLSFKTELYDLFKQQHKQINEQTIQQIDNIHAQIVEKLENGTSRNEKVLRKTYVAFLNQLLGKSNLKIQKKKICDFYGVDSSKNSQYTKNLLPQSTLQMNAQKQTNTISECLIMALMNVSNEALIDYTPVNMILAFVGIVSLQLQPTTISVVLEYNHLAHLQGNLFLLEQIYQNIQKAILPKNLIEIRTKSKYIDFTQSPIEIQKIKKSGIYVKQMNTSICFTFKSYQYKNKQYKLQVFPGGKIKIAGLLKPYFQSEVQYMAIDTIKFLSRQFDDSSIIHQYIPYCKTIMSNYKLQLPIPSGSIIDIISIKEYFEQDSYPIQQICQQQGSQCIDLKIDHHRLYINLGIKKEDMGFKCVNLKSTSLRHSLRSISFNISIRGVVLVQGADDDLLKTDRIVQLLRHIHNQIFTNFVIIPKQYNNISPVLFSNQLNMIGLAKYLSNVSTNETKIASTSWVQMHQYGILQGIGISNRYKYPVFFILVQRRHDIDCIGVQSPWYSCKQCHKHCQRELKIPSSFLMIILSCITFE